MPPPSPPPLPPPPSPSSISAFLRSYDVDPVHGFLPSPPPLPRLPHPAFQPHEDLAAVLPQLLTSSTARAAIEALPAITATTTRTLLHDNEPAQRRALLLFGGLASAYVWGGGVDVTPRDYLPACIAVPLYEVARLLETCPILSHQSNCLYNWKKTGKEEGEEEGMHNGDSNGGGTSSTDCSGGSSSNSSSTLSNPLLQAKDLALTFSFTGDDNERMFYLLTLEIEAVGAQALPLLEEARRTAKRLFLTSSRQEKEEREERVWHLNHKQQKHQNQEQEQQEKQQQHLDEGEESIINALTRVRGYIQGCQSILLSMPRFVDPAFFYHRVRPYLSGWKNNPSLPEKVVYRSVVLKEGEEEGLKGGGGKVEQNGQEQARNGNSEHGPRLQYSGGSAAQSSLLPSLDLYLGVNHNETGKGSQSSYQFLKAMRTYMPKGHRRFLEALEEEVEVEDEDEEKREEGMSIRRYVVWRCGGEEGGREGGREDGVRLRKAYDGCVEALVGFRKSHLGIVHLYITQQQQQHEGGGREGGKKGGGGLEEAAGGKGTGGQAPKEFLEPLREQTAAARLEGKTKL